MSCLESILRTLATSFILRLLAGPGHGVNHGYRTFRVYACSIACGAVWAQAIFAGSADEAAEASRSAATNLNATVQHRMIGWEEHKRVCMNVSGRRLMLEVPLGFRAELASPEKVVLVNLDYSCLLSFRIAAPASAATGSLKTDLCRTWLSARLGDLKIKDEFSLIAANGSGPAFDLYCKVDGVVRASRVAFIASPIGVMEFDSLSSMDKFEEAKAKLQFVLHGFQISDANGQLQVLPAVPAGT